MSEIYNNIDDLLGKKLALETSPEEENLLQNWLKESPDNEQYFKDLKSGTRTHQILVPATDG